ncbi:MAG: hypothetical protein KIS85_03715 [Anaerolineales bacterium]|nr:hypothetical protein [Anaerolineales bacterium]
MYRNRILALFSVLMIVSLLLGACAAPAAPTTEAPTDPSTGEPVTETPGEEPSAPVSDRTGAWVDTVIVVEEPSIAAAVTRMETGDLDVYSFSSANAEAFANVQSSDALCYVNVYGNFDELTLNPAEFVEGAPGVWNPFSNPRLREGLHWIIDRNHITQEIYQGLAIPRYTALSTVNPTGASMADTMREVEIAYGYDLERGRERITEEMTAMGASLDGGVWTIDGAPVELIFLIRTEDERRIWGDYISNQLEEIGFTVIRDYRTAAEASPLWLNSPAADGLWHLYTGGWAATAINREEVTTFAQFYSNRILGGTGLFDAYNPSPEFDAVIQAIFDSDFSTAAERTELFKEAIWYSLEDSNKLFLLTRTPFSAQRCEVSITADLAGGVNGSALWSQTLRRVGEEGGSITMAMPSILTQPWNPVNGSNWVYDQQLNRGIGEFATIPDPYTGLALPYHVESAAVTVVTGLPSKATLDWVSLSFADEIAVPGDAWADWDAETQTFLTVDEVYPDGVTAQRVSTVVYPANLYDVVKWHDGSNFSVADVVMNMILTFDRGKEASAIFDSGSVGALNAFMSSFRGVRITSTSPLTIETYTNLWSQDAENMVTTWWPMYGFGQGAWHNLAVGNSAEANGLLAYSTSKATANEVEQTNFISGPALEVLAGELAALAEAGHIPYEATLGDFISADEAAARWDNLSEWYRTRGHFLVGTGVFYLERAFPVEGTVILRRFLDHPFRADRWLGFAAPAVPEVDVEGDNLVTIGDEANFDVYVSFDGAAYAASNIDTVSYMVIDATGAVASTGTATAVADGHWQITLDAATTGALEEGSNSLEVVVISAIVSIPGSASFGFVTAP